MRQEASLFSCDSMPDMDSQQSISPLRSLVIVVLSIIVVEWGAMGILGGAMGILDMSRLGLHEYVVYLIDGLIMAVILFPILYGFIFKPIGRLVGRLQRSLQLAETSNQAKSKFLSLISHEMRTPLNGIIGLSNMLREKDAGDNSEIVENIVYSSELLLHIINDMLDFSHLSSGDLKIEAKQFNLNKALTSVFGIINSTAKSANVEVKAYRDPQLPDELIGDEARLQQILLNIIGNAVKFSSRNDRAGHVAVKVLCKEYTPRYTTINFVVSDDGIGIPNSKISVIFEPFMQADERISRQHGGMGLGLAISKYLAQAMNGDIHVDSAPGRGSTFTAQLTFKSVATLIKPEITETLGNKPGANTGSPAHRAARTRAMADTRSNRHKTEEPIAASVTRVSKAGASPATYDRDKQKQQYSKQTGRSAIAAKQSRPDNRHAILIADDNEINRKVIQHQLSGFNAQTDVANDGHEALKLWRANHYDMIFTDLHMPGMDGYELAETIRSADSKIHNVDIPIVAITADNSADVKVKCLSAGMDDYLVKPVSNESLKTTVDRWVPNKAAPAAAGMKTRKKIDTAQKCEHIVLSSLIELVGDEPSLIQEYLDEFHRSLVKTVKEITRATKSGHFLQVKELMHKLKSSSLAVGAKRLGRLCEKIQNKISDDKNPGIAELIQDFAIEVVAVIDEIKALRTTRLRS